MQDTEALETIDRFADNLAWLAKKVAYAGTRNATSTALIRSDLARLVLTAGGQVSESKSTSGRGGHRPKYESF